MEIISDCCSSIETYNCQYGAHLFDGSIAKIYVNHWLDVDDSLRNKFARRNKDGFIGHCLLVFKGVKEFLFDVMTNIKVNGETIWSDPVSFHYTGTPAGTTTKRAPSGTGQSSAQDAGQKKPDTNVVSSGNTSTNTGNANTNAGAVNKVGGAATSAGSINSSTSFVDSLLKPNGQFVGRVEGGATPNIRTVSNQDFSTLQSQLITGAKPVGQYSGGKGTWYDLPSGGRVGVRRSDDFGLTLDVNIPGYPSGFNVHQK